MPPIRSITRGFIHGLAAASLITGAELLHAQNLLANGGFEGGFAGWTNATSGGGNASFSLETGLQYEGANCLKAVIVHPGADSWNVETRGPILTNFGTGQSISITFRARADTDGAKFRAVLQNGAYRMQEFTLSTKWTRFVWNTTAAETSPQLKFNYRTRGTVWLDDISVVKNPAPGNLNISLNPTVRHQVMDGIGGSIAFNLPAYEALSATQKNEIENLLYVDCGIDIVRLRTGNSDTLNNELAMRAKRNGAKSLLTCWSPPPSLNNPHFPALRSDSMALSGASRRKQSPSSDGLKNGIEAWFGTHPGVPSPGITEISSDGTTIAFRHPRNENPPDGLTGFYEWSRNLVDWYQCDGVEASPDGSTVTIATEENAATTTVTATASAPADMLFLRVVVIGN